MEAEEDEDDSSDEEDHVLMGMSPDLASGPRGQHMAGHFLRGVRTASSSGVASHR